MSSHSTSLGCLPAEDGTLIHRDDAVEESHAAVTGVSAQSSIMSITTSNSDRKDTFDAANSPSLRRHGTMLSLSTHYSESSFGSPTELSGTTIARSVSSAGMITGHGGVYCGYQKDGFSTSIARERRKRLQQERLSRAVRHREKAPETVSNPVPEPGSPEKLARAQVVPVTKIDGKALEADERMQKLGTTAQQRAASTEATARLIRHAKEILNASKADIMRLKKGQEETERGDGPVPQRRHTTGVLSRTVAARLQSKRATVDGSEQVHGAASNLGSVSKPAERIQELMAQFDREIKARVEANIKEQRRQRQGINFSVPYVLRRPKDSNISQNKPADQAPRPNMTEQDPALSTNVTIVAREEEPIVGCEVMTAGRLSTGLEDTHEQVSYFNHTTPVEDEPSAELDFSISGSYDVERVIPEHAAVAQMVPVRKARLVKVAPRPVSVHHGQSEAGTSRGSSRSQSSQMDLPRLPNRTPSKSHLIVGQNDRVSSPRPGLSTWEMKLAQSLQPEDFVVSTNPGAEWLEETDRNHARPTSPFQRPSGALSCRLEEQFKDRLEEEGKAVEKKELEQKDEDDISLFSVDGATNTEGVASPAVPLFNMPNRPFLYHPEPDEECPSLTTDDDQDRRTEEARLGSQDVTPLTPSPPFQFERGLVKTEDSMSETQSWLTSAEDARSNLAPSGASATGNVTRTTTRGNKVHVNVEIESDGFSAIGDSLYSGEAGEVYDGYKRTPWI